MKQAVLLCLIMIGLVGFFAEIPNVIASDTTVDFKIKAAERIDIPVNTWVARSLPGRGEAPTGNMKHIRLAHNSENGRIYLLGGDYGGASYQASGRNEIFSYSVENNQWYLEQEYCRADKKSQPSGPDQVGWI